jgi:hypothetical protein
LRLHLADRPMHITIAGLNDLPQFLGDRGLREFNLVPA